MNTISPDNLPNRPVNTLVNNTLPNNMLPNNMLIGELERMRALAAGEALQVPAEVDPDNNFSLLLRKQLDDVNALRQESAKLAQLFEVGDPNVSLVDVMVAGQKSKVAFSALVEVRNKMLTAYQEVMSMQV